MNINDYFDIGSDKDVFRSGFYLRNKNKEPIFCVKFEYDKNLKLFKFAYSCAQTHCKTKAEMSEMAYERLKTKPLFISKDLIEEVLKDHRKVYKHTQYQPHHHLRDYILIFCGVRENDTKQGGNSGDTKHKT